MFQEGRLCLDDGKSRHLPVYGDGRGGNSPVVGEGQGFDQTSLFNLVAVMNAAAAIGRIAVGALSDTIGRFNTCVSIMTLSVIVMFGLFFNVGGMIWKFYVFAAFWGFVYGAVLMMISVLVREQCNHEEFGRYLSACHVALSIAGLVCVPLSAQMLASFGPQMDVVFFGILCTVSLLFMILTRWAFLDYKWSWTSKV
uniref:Major facilitator superfamily (MFS) profile domain-containing protein n=1 Tax=Bionectria ochroleuca TaxID=29856 RepID=A0A8H7NN82_BIOOC